MTDRTSLTVVLAAGEGTRMRSSLPKVLHPVAGQPLLAHVLEAAPHGAGTSLAVVVGPDHGAVEVETKRLRPDAATFVQRERLGTAHAVLAAREAISRGADDLLVAFGDTPLISAETFARMRAPLAKGAALTVLGFRAADPTGYGRLDGVRRPQGARGSRQDRKCQQQGRILSRRCRHHRAGHGIGGRRD
jgi:bifunctional UDP-N-acetylglucosamine pyrophosphorylase/glucosamine-1-phosphate N-acetyltransferase